MTPPGTLRYPGPSPMLEMPGRYGRTFQARNDKTALRGGLPVIIQRGKDTSAGETFKRYQLCAGFPWCVCITNAVTGIGLTVVETMPRFDNNSQGDIERAPTWNGRSGAGLRAVVQPGGFSKANKKSVVIERGPGRACAAFRPVLRPGPC